VKYDAGTVIFDYSALNDLKIPWESLQGWDDLEHSHLYNMLEGTELQDPP